MIELLEALMAGTDLKAERKDLYAPRLGVFVDIVVPPMTFLAIDGTGDPNVSEDYRHAIEALFSASYAAKFLSKRELHSDYVVLPLEGQWWADDVTAFHTRDTASWSWRMLIRQPAWVGADVLSEAVRKAEEKGAVAARQLRPYMLDEGRCVQTLHVGSYDDEAPVLARLHDEYLPQHSLKPRGLHHEIYLSDARRTAPVKLRTILRQPVATAPRP
ncbi:MAG: GyrI-like domain-containing protein [Actinomycetota bacterium]|nr:GyrI-like domain-containing protein [Actinomycetota bacterium]